MIPRPVSLRGMVTVVAMALGWAMTWGLAGAGAGTILMITRVGPFEALGWRAAPALLAILCAIIGGVTGLALGLVVTMSSRAAEWLRLQRRRPTIGELTAPPPES